jgi:hypothetical protein
VSPTVRNTSIIGENVHSEEYGSPVCAIAETSPDARSCARDRTEKGHTVERLAGMCDQDILCGCKRLRVRIDRAESFQNGRD